MKILLILAHDRIYRCGGPFKRLKPFAPLGLTTLAALVPPGLEAQIDIVDEGVQKPAYENHLYSPQHQQYTFI